MRFSSPRRTALLRAGAVLSLLAACAGAPSVARAGCSHYVSTIAGQPGYGDLDDLQILAIAAEGTAPAVPPRDRLPCSGPSCSRGPGVPDTAAPPVSIRAEPWCDTTFPPRCAAPDPVAALREAPLHRPSRCATSIDRPPRLPLA